MTVDEQSSLIPREEEAAASWEELRAVSDCHLVAKPTSIIASSPLPPFFILRLLSSSSSSLALTGTS